LGEYGAEVTTDGWEGYANLNRLSYYHRQVIAERDEGELRLARHAARRAHEPVGPAHGRKIPSVQCFDRCVQRLADKITDLLTGHFFAFFAGRLIFTTSQIAATTSARFLRAARPVARFRLRLFALDIFH
jgi:hypothetical protein